jgi:hypothetical protein
MELYMNKRIFDVFVEVNDIKEIVLIKRPQLYPDKRYFVFRDMECAYFCNASFSPDGLFEINDVKEVGVDKSFSQQFEEMGDFIIEESGDARYLILAILCKASFVTGISVWKLIDKMNSGMTELGDFDDYILSGLRKGRARMLRTLEGMHSIMDCTKEALKFKNLFESFELDMPSVACPLDISAIYEPFVSTMRIGMPGLSGAMGRIKYGHGVTFTTTKSIYMENLTYL